MALEKYRRKRDFKKTPEPAGRPHAKGGNSFVIQKHAARRLHYDFRLEMDGVLRSWAVPKGPSLDPGEKRLAVHVEDHPIEYGGFEGTIPAGQYGGGTVLLWDRGTWHPEGDPLAGYRKGHLRFRLAGEKLHGGWNLVRMHGERAGEDKENWLLIKENDEAARPGSADAIVRERPESVDTGLGLEEIAADPDRVWQSDRAEKVAKKGEKKAAAPRPAKVPRRAALAAAVPDPKEIPGARKGALPARVAPQLATLVDAAPHGAEWLHEIKYDGYRALCAVRGGKARVLTRNGKDWTDRFAVVAHAAAALPVKDALLDGEVVVIEADGTTSFQALQNALGEGRESDLVYFAFDLLHLDGYDLRPAPLAARKQALAALLAGADPAGTICFSDHVEGEGESFYRQACSFALEGVVAKRADLPYRSGRHKDWLKVKCLQRQEFVIGGFTEPEGSRKGLGALLLGVYEEGEGGDLVFAGKVGTGFDDRMLLDLRKRLGKLERRESPFASPPRELARGTARGDVHWVAPRLVAEIAFTEWTREGILRHPTFQGLREDKDPGEVLRERAAPAAEAAAAAGKGPAKGKKAGARKTARTGTTQSAAKATRPAAKKTGGGKAGRKGTAAAARSAVAPQPAAAVASTARAGKSGKEMEVGGIRLTHPDKVLFPGMGLTKRELALYYEHIAGWILPHLAGRPLTLVRCPEGQGKECFYQKHVTDQFPPAVHRVEVEENAKTVPYGAVDSLAGLLSLVQMGVLELHIWGAHRDDIERPDYVVFDLDPDVGLAWERVVAGARLLRDLLAGLGLRSFLKTTGGKGLHVVVPLTRRLGWDEVKAFTKAVAEAVAAAEPERYTANLSKAKRSGRIFIDYLRNGRGATSIAAYSTRARPGAPVSTPLHWDELDSDVRANSFDVRNLPARLESLRADPWQGFAKVRQSITAAMRKAVGLG
jgi:bifunctional non-homologous end joining protein LigD